MSYARAIRRGMGIGVDLGEKIGAEADKEIAALKADIVALKVCLARVTPLDDFDSEVLTLRKDFELLKSSIQFWQNRVAYLEAELARPDRLAVYVAGTEP